jgi:hypothetical protein
MPQFKIQMLKGSIFDFAATGEDPSSKCPDDEPRQSFEESLSLRLAAANRTLSTIRRCLQAEAEEEKLSPSDKDTDASRTGDVDSAVADEDWTFHAGEAEFAGRRFRVAGIQLKLLRQMAQARFPQTAQGLIDDVWDEKESDQVEVKTLRTHLSHLRKKLRAAFGLGEDCDPIPNMDRGTEAAWKLDSDLILRSQRKFNADSDAE